MSNLKSIGIGIFIIGLAFGFPSILVKFDIVFSDMVQLVMQLGIMVLGLYFMIGDDY